MSARVKSYFIPAGFITTQVIAMSTNGIALRVVVNNHSPAAGEVAIFMGMINRETLTQPFILTPGSEPPGDYFIIPANQKDAFVVNGYESLYAISANDKAAIISVESYSLDSEDEVSALLI